VILTGVTSSSVFGGVIPDRVEKDYMHGEYGRELVGDADVVAAVWTPSRNPIICRAPEGVTIEALEGRLERVGATKSQRGALRPTYERQVKLYPSVTEEEFREQMRRERHG
jgi:hypothetical protein